MELRNWDLVSSYQVQKQRQPRPCMQSFWGNEAYHHNVGHFRAIKTVPNPPWLRSTLTICHNITIQLSLDKIKTQFSKTFLSTTCRTFKLASHICVSERQGNFHSHFTNCLTLDFIQIQFLNVEDYSKLRQAILGVIRYSRNWWPHKSPVLNYFL